MVENRIVQTDELSTVDCCTALMDVGRTLQISYCIVLFCIVSINSSYTVLLWCKWSFLSLLLYDLLKLKVSYMLHTFVTDWNLLWCGSSAADFPKFLGITMETFITLIDDSDIDVKMVADECLNRVIRVRTFPRWIFTSALFHMWLSKWEITKPQLECYFWILLIAFWNISSFSFCFTSLLSIDHSTLGQVIWMSLNE